MRLILLGPPGSGKGTQADRIAKHLGIKHISTGEILRLAIQKGSPLGREAYEYVKAGKLVTDELINRLIEEELTDAGTENGFLLDGYPRTLPQVEFLERLLKSFGKTIDRVIYINVSLGKIIERLGGRRTCSKCQRVYHTVYSPSAKGEICEVCGGNLYQREDDKPSVIKKRYEEYINKTEKLLDYFRSKDNFVEINGEQGIEEVYKEILKVLGILLYRNDA